MMRDFDGSTSQADALREKLGAEGSSATAVEANLSKLMADWTRDTRNSKESLRTVVHAHTGLEPVDSPTKQALSQDLINDLAPLNFTDQPSIPARRHPGRRPSGGTIPTGAQTV